MNKAKAELDKLFTSVNDSSKDSEDSGKGMWNFDETDKEATVVS